MGYGVKKEVNFFAFPNKCGEMLFFGDENLYLLFCYCQL